ncbi:MAG: glycerophosphodiester phosphodiesterase [Acutalibacteraceae bacterium]
MSKENFRFQAHRGDSAFFPENTITAYKAAVDQGYQVVEMDTKFTSDNVCICLHDDTYNRTCRFDDGSAFAEKIPAEALTLEQAKALDAGMFKDERFRGTRIPTLAEALAFLKDKNVTVKMDNIFQGFTQERFEIFCDTIASADMEDRIAFTCKTLPYFTYLTKRFPKAEMHYDGSLTPEALNITSALAAHRLTLWVPYDNPSTAWFKGRKADAEFCRELHRYGKVGIWLISEVEELRVAVNEFCADIIETNGTLKPDALKLI